VKSKTVEVSRWYRDWIIEGSLHLEIVGNRKMVIRRDSEKGLSEIAVCGKTAAIQSRIKASIGIQKVDTAAIGCQCRSALPNRSCMSVRSKVQNASLCQIALVVADQSTRVGTVITV